MKPAANERPRILVLDVSRGVIVREPHNLGPGWVPRRATEWNSAFTT
jgi:hypothetical protein